MKVEVADGLTWEVRERVRTSCDLRALIVCREVCM